MNEGKGLVPGYPKSMLDVMGKTNIAAVHGSAHKFIRGSLLTLIGPEAIRDQLLPEIDKFMRNFINNWDGKTIDIQEKAIEVYNHNISLESRNTSFHHSGPNPFHCSWRILTKYEISNLLLATRKLGRSIYIFLNLIV